MIQTPNLGLEKYELTDAANLADGYNNSMDTLDKFAGDTNAHFPVKTNDIADNAITNAKLNNGAVTTDKIVDANVTNSKLASDSVTTDKIKSFAITNEKLAQNSVGTANIMNDSVDNNKLYDKSVTTNKLADGCVTTNKLADECVTTNNLADGCVTAAKLAEGSFTQIRTDFTAADTQIRTDFTAADTQIRTDFAAADTALDARISTLESIPFGGDVVLLGDSYGEGHNPDGNVTSWIEIATTALARRGVNVYSRYLGGIGIVAKHEGVNFATLLDQLGNSLTDAQKKKVGTVYIGGGWNDGNSSVADFRTGINAIENYAHSHFSNAKIVYDWFGFGNWLVNSSVANQSISITSGIERAFEAVKTSNFKNVSLLDSTYLLRKASYFASDGIHPTLSGQQKLANHVIDVLAGVFDVDAKRYGLVSDIPINGIINGSISSNTAAIVKNGAFVFNQINAFLKGNIILSTAMPVTFNGNVFTLYTSNTNALVFGTESFDIPITICVELQNSNAGIAGSYINVNGFLHFFVSTSAHRLEMTFYAKNASPTGTDYLSGKLKQIQFSA